MAKEYEVIKSDQLTRVSDTRGLENYWRVQIRTKGGVVLSVDVDADDFTPERVAPILQGRATNADRILSL